MSTFKIYITKNYEKHMNDYKGYIYNKYNNRLLIQEIEDIYQDCILTIINTNSEIVDPKSYLWISLRNKTIEYIKRKDSDKFKYDLEEVDPHYLIDVVENDYYVDLGFVKLMEASKLILDKTEYMIIVNRIYNNLTYRQIASLVGYSPAFVYKKNKIILDKLKKEIYDKKGKYFED